MSTPKSAAEDAYTKFLISKVNETITQRDIFNAGHAAGLAEAGELLAACDKLYCLNFAAGKPDVALVKWSDWETFRAAVMRFKALAGEGT